MRMGRPSTCRSLLRAQTLLNQIIPVLEKSDYPLQRIIYLEQYSILIHQVHYRSYLFQND